MYDVIVVGAGIEGSSTAYQLAKKGANVLLLEQVSNFSTLQKGISKRRLY